MVKTAVVAITVAALLLAGCGTPPRSSTPLPWPEERICGVLKDRTRVPDFQCEQRLPGRSWFYADPYKLDADDYTADYRSIDDDYKSFQEPPSYYKARKTSAPKTSAPKKTTAAKPTTKKKVA